MIARALEIEIVRLYHAEHWPVGTIARQLRVHHATVRRVLAQAGVPVTHKIVRPSMVEPYRAFMIEILTKYPTLRASRLYTMVRERGYPGAPDHFRALVARLRPRPAARSIPAPAHACPGEQGQVDWAHFGKLTRGTRGASADGLRDGAVLLAPSVPALLLRGLDELLRARSCRCVYLL